MKFARLLLCSVLVLPFSACRKDGSVPSDSQKALLSSEFGAHRSKDSLVLTFCGEGGTVGVDSVGSADTVGLFTDRFEKLLWNGKTDSIKTAYEQYSLRSLGLPCRSGPWFPVAVVNPSHDDFRPLVADTAGALDPMVMVRLIAQAGRLMPDTEKAVGESPEIVNEWYRKAPRILTLREGNESATLLQFDCGSQQTFNCGPLFRLLGGSLQLLPGPISSRDLHPFRYSGHLFLVNYAGMPDCGNVWTDLIRLDPDSSRVILTDGRFGD
jgi:hypothetical protein